MTRDEFDAGMNRLLSLRVESRLTTKLLQNAYIQSLGFISSESWAYVVDLAMASEPALPTPSWFIGAARYYEEQKRKSMESEERAKRESDLNAEFPPDVAIKNVQRLKKLIQGIGDLDV